MGKLDLQLNQDYKSFKNGFQLTLEGSLAILSGINGTGKSQILDMVRGYEYQNVNAGIAAQVTLDNISLTRNDIMYKSFKDNVNIAELTQANVQTIINTRSQVHSNYSSNGLNPDDPNLAQYTSSTTKARQLLIKAYSQERFDSRQLTPEDIELAIKPDFIWKPDDIFTNAVGEIFYNFCLKKQDAYVKAGMTSKKADLTMLGVPPWEELNGLFAELGFGYRFKDDYWLDGADINEQPKLFALDDKGTIDIESSRPLTQLSDGEKAIISLCFASLNGAKPENVKLLLLDEYDATLNPSLAEKLFVVIDKYFLSKNVMVVFVTHSPATISLAPTFTSFYEVYKPRDGKERVLKVSRDYYEELHKVHKAFYDKVADQDARIDEIAALNEELEATKQLLDAQAQQNSERPLIITEGVTDAMHLQCALEKLGLSEEFDVEFFDQTDEEKALGSSNLFDTLHRLSLIGHNRKIIGVFDRDEATYIREIGDLKEFGNNVYGLCIPVPDNRSRYENVSIEFYYTDAELHKVHEGRSLYFDNEVDTIINKSTREQTFNKADPIRHEDENKKKIFSEKNMCENTSWIQSKTRFAELVSSEDEFGRNFNFDNFSLIFDAIRNILNN